MSEYLREKKEEMERRSSSLEPPYPSFVAFIQDLLENGIRAQEIASLVVNPRTKKPILEEVVNAWVGGTQAGSHLRSAIKTALGYDFQEYLFAEVARSVGFPGSDVSLDIKAITSMYGLRLFILDVVEKIGPNSVTDYFEIASSNTVREFGVGEMGVAEETLKKILEKIAELPDHISGAILSQFTPKPIISRVMRECRQRRGMDRKVYAKHLNFDYHYYSYLESIDEKYRGDQKHGVYTQDPRRLIELCIALMRDRVELGLAEIREEVVQPESPPPQPTELEVDQPKVSRVEPVVEKTKNGLTPTLSGIDEELIQKVVSLVAGLEAIQPQLDELLRRTGRKRTPSARYVSPFSSERWHHHGAPVDETRIGTVRALIMALCEELGHLAAVEDEPTRAKIREELDDALMIELVGAIDLFGQQYPGAAIRLMNSWRKELGI